jgi:hypothetical protein
MSRKKARHLAPVPPEGTAKPASRPMPVLVEIPTGGHLGIAGLLHELANYAFPLAGFSFEIIPGRGPRCTATVLVSENFTGEQVAAGTNKIIRALVGLGILKTKPAAPAEDGAESPLPPPQSPPT